MTRVGNTEHIMALLRSQLHRMAGRDRTQRSRKPGEPASREPTTQERIQALAEIENLSDEEFCSALVRTLLADEFGDAVANSAGFQHIVTRTSNAMRTDREIAQLLRTVRQSL